MIQAGIALLGVAVFFAGAAFQEVIEIAGYNHPDGGYGSAVVSVWAFLAAYRLIMRARR